MGSKLVGIIGVGYAGAGHLLEEMLEKMRERGIDYLVGTPKGHLSRVEKPLLEQTWMQARESVRVKILQQESEFSVYGESQDRVAEDRSMRRCRLRRLWAGLRELRNRKTLTRDDLLMHIGALFVLFQDASHRTRNRMGKLSAVDTD